MNAPLPSPGAVVRVRQRHYLVNDLAPRPHEATLVRLSCLDDDDPGAVLEVLWEHELDAALVSDAPRGLTGDRGLDDPRRFAAWLHALRWNTVTSTDKRLLQAPFRAGIDLKAYQLEPLRKALELPRVNLFIADDVGLGKTIEAGLVMQELMLRQRIDRVLVVAPPAVTHQWQEELEQRFGLSFALYDSAYVAARRRERGWGVNPWTTHTRFIVSYALLRGSRRQRGGPRTPHLELLLRALPDRPERTLLILDECHQVAPSSAGLYPVDSRTTRAVRQLAPRFEHKLFLSATPHNGHSHSFSALLHLLDAQRFTRGVPVDSARELAPVMVRRLKRHLRETVGGFPERVLVDHVVQTTGDEPEIRLGHLLARYEDLYRRALSTLPPGQQQARSLVLVGLHKRLLSSIRAFSHTLSLHARGVDRTLEQARQLALPEPPRRDVDDDLPDDALDARDDEFTEAASVDAGAAARAILDEMRSLAAEHEHRPDARVRALADWMNAHLCPDGRWTETRVVVFTEYEHTLQWLSRVLPELLHADCTDRVRHFTGRLSDAAREDLKRAFNAADHPVRILLATDAAREGINLQAQCAHLFHYDLPWNPSRIEQRNGRIDRVLQPSPKVWCHYFVVPDRPEDRVLAYVARKLEVIRDELGSLSQVISARLAERMEQGLRDVTPADIDDLSRPEASAVSAQRALEGEGAELLRGDLDRLRNQLERSRKAVDYAPEHLRDVVDLGLELVAGQGLVPREGGDVPSFELPPLDPSWHGVLAGMRERAPDDAPPWHVPPVKPVAFRAAHRLDADTVQLHLGHPLVVRLLSRFRAQGFSRDDLSRVTLIENPRDQLRRVVAFGRLTLFGHGATRLHEELVAVAARCTEEGLALFGADGERATVDRLLEAFAHQPRPHPDEALHRAVLRRVRSDAEVLWAALEPAAAEREARAAELLSQRGRDEADAMTALLERQRKGIHAALREHDQLALRLGDRADLQRQHEADRAFMNARLDAIDAELTTEPEAVRRGYDVVLRRFEPVGVAYLWPTS